MSTWGEISELFLDTVGHSGYAAREKWKWLTLAYREIGARATVRELFQPKAVQACTPGQDYIDLDTDVYSMISVVDTTTGRPLKREAGWVERLRFCEAGDSMPPEGELTHWYPWAKRLYLRNTPTDDRDLHMSFRFHPPELTNADLTLHPATPNQFDEAIMWLAVHKYDTAHPSETSAKRNARGEAENILGIEKQQRAEEKSAGMFGGYVSMLGYNFNNR